MLDSICSNLQDESNYLSSRLPCKANVDAKCKCGPEENLNFVKNRNPFISHEFIAAQIIWQWHICRCMHSLVFQLKRNGSKIKCSPSQRSEMFALDCSNPAVYGMYNWNGTHMSVSNTIAKVNETNNRNSNWKHLGSRYIRAMRVMVRTNAHEEIRITIFCSRFGNRRLYNYMRLLNGVEAEWNEMMARLLEIIQFTATKRKTCVSYASMASAEH